MSPTPAVCPVHNLPWRWKEAGISQRTGKAYSGFYSCPERDCSQRPQPDPKQPPRTQPQGNVERSGAPGGTVGAVGTVGKMVAALQFAGSVHQGTSDNLAAMETAQMAFRWLQTGGALPKADPIPVPDDIGF